MSLTPQPMFEPETNGSGERSWLLAVALVFTVALFAGLGYLWFKDSRRRETQMAALQAQVQALQMQAGEAAETSRSAMAEAERAQKNAHLAAVGRAQAEEISAEAARDAEQSRQRADGAAAEAQQARAEADEIRQRREAEIERLQKALGKIADTERTAVGLVMTLSSDSVKFDFDKATLRPGDRELLSRVAGVLLTAYGFRIQIFGHTDDVGTEQYNQGLSERRAQAVRDYLVEAGVSPDLMTTRGFGKSSPRVAGNGQEARAKNRRVEIGIIDSIIGYGEVSQQVQ